MHVGTSPALPCGMIATKIVVGTDFSDEAELAFDHAMGVARHTGGSITLMHALNLSVDAYGTAFVPPVPDVYAAQAKEIQMEARNKLEQSPERHLGQGVEISHIFVEQLAGNSILSVAKDSGADLIVVGSHGHGWIKGLLLGSVSSRVAKYAECDVLVARGPAPNGSYKNILVPTDFSETSKRVIERAVAILAPGGRIELLHAWQLPGGPATYWGAVGPGFRESLRRSAIDFGEKAIRDVAGPGVDIHFTQVEGEPRRAIKDALEKGDFDLVMMGTHGRRGLERLLLGSVAESMIRSLESPVYLVRDPLPHDEQ